MSQLAMVTQDIRSVGFRSVGVAVALLAAVLAIVAGIGRSSSPSVSRAPASPARHGFASLPVAARGAVSRGLGADDRRFWARRSAARGGVVILGNPIQHLAARLDRGAITVHGSHGDQFGLSAPAVGRAGAVAAVHGLSAAHTSRNRVTFSTTGVQEWFSNGPWGIEQGFTLAHRVSGSGPLRITQTITGTMRAHVDAGQDALTLRAYGRTLRYQELTVTDAHGHAIPAHLSVIGRHLTIAIMDTHAAYPLHVDPTIQQTAELTASDGAAGDHLGWSVAISGTTIVASAPGRTVAGHSYQGAVYVFTAPAGGWATTATPTAELTASDGAANDQLGSSAAISGTTIVAGAGYRNRAQGAVYEWTMPAGGWVTTATPTAELTASDGASNDFLGYSVAASGTTIAAGAYGHSVGGNGYRGAVYEWTMPAGGWVTTATPTAELTASDGAASDQLGHSVAVSGTTIAASAPNHTVGANTYQGAVYEWTMPASGWTNATDTAELTASDGAANDRLGSSVAVSGTAIAAGDLDHTVGANAYQGAVYEWTMPAGGWTNATETAELTASDGAAYDQLGTSVAISATTIVAGAAAHTAGGSGHQGAGYVYTMPASGWATTDTPTSELTASDGNTNDNFGFSSAVSGTTIVAGSLHAVAGNTYQGAVYVSARSVTGSLALSPASITADGTSTSTATFTATNGDGSPAIGDNVSITTSGAQVVGPVTPGAIPGTYQATITATATAGSATITATDSSVSAAAAATATLTQDAGPAAHVVLALSPASISADGTSTTTATASVADAHGNPISADPVTLASSGAQQVGPVSAGATPGTYQATITSTTTPGDSTITATDTATGSATATATLTQLDIHAPSIDIDTPVDGAQYTQGQTVAASYRCLNPDGPSDVASCTGPSASDTDLDTTTTGSHSFTVTAIDYAGNTSHQTVTYTVLAKPTAPPATTLPAATLPATTPPATTSTDTTPPATTLPTLGALHLAATRFRVASSPTATRGRASSSPIGTVLTTTINEPATIMIEVQRPTTGRLSNAGCVKETIKLRHAKACTRWLTLSPTLQRKVPAGKVTIGGPLGSLRLASGPARLSVTAIDAAGNRSTTRTIAFTVVAH